MDEARRLNGPASQRVSSGLQRRQELPASEGATDFPIKHGGIAAQRADIAAAIASPAGAPADVQQFDPVVHGILLGVEEPLYLSARITGGHGSASRISDTPEHTPPTKIAAKHLAPYLEKLR